MSRYRTKICAHCGGKGETQAVCCSRKAGVNRNSWCPDWVVCCACGGRGVLSY